MAWFVRVVCGCTNDDTLTVAVIGNGLILAHLSPFLTPIVEGVIILIAIWLNFRVFRTGRRDT